MFRILALLFALTASAFSQTVVAPLLSFPTTTLGSTVTPVKGASFFTVVEAATIKCYAAAQKATVIASYAADPNFAGWEIMDSADDTRRILYTADSSKSISAKAYGADPTGAADSAAAINAALTAAATAGAGDVYLPPGTYKFNSTITFPATGKVRLVGAGGGYRSNTAPMSATAGTVLSMGANFTPAILMSATNGGVRTCDDAGIGDLFIDSNGNGAGAIAIEMDSCCRCFIRRVGIQNFNTGGIHVSCVASLTGDPCDSQHNVFEDLVIQQTAGGAASAYGMQLDGTTTANTSYNFFRNILIRTANGPCIDLVNADDDFFYDLRLSTTGTGYGMIFENDLAGTNKFARHNSVFGVSCPPTGGGTQGGVQFKGTGTGNDSDMNIIYGYSLANAAPLPTFDTNVRNVVITDMGQRYAGRPTKLTGPATTNALSMTSCTDITCDTSGGAVTINGLNNGVDGQVVRFYNFGSNALNLQNNNASGTQKLLTTTGANVGITRGVVALRYDSASGFWYQIAAP